MAATMLKLNVKQWAAEDQPCNRMLQMGTQYLTDAELLAILVGSGTQKKDAVEVARCLLANFNNNLAELSKAKIQQLKEIEGVGNKTLCKIMAAFELGRRRQLASMNQNPVISSPSDIYKLMLPLMQNLDVEEFHVCLMNQKCKVIKTVKISRGGLTGTLVDVRIIMREAVMCNATVMALAHNHPSGNNTPSNEDNKLTAEIKKACDIMRIHLLDHVIVCENSYYSYNEMGRL